MSPPTAPATQLKQTTGKKVRAASRDVRGSKRSNTRPPLHLPSTSFTVGASSGRARRGVKTIVGVYSTTIENHSCQALESFRSNVAGRFGIGFPQARSAPELFRSNSEDAFPVQETITARRATPVCASCARRCMMAAEPRIASSPGANISSITITANSVSVARDTASSALVASVTDQPWPK
eukprot:scaffold85189_cov67-Phaeocystis_antarctica.AAC.1